MVVPIVVTSFIALTALEFDPRGFHEVSAIRFSSIFTPKTPISIESRIPPSNCRVSFEKKKSILINFLKPLKLEDKSFFDDLLISFSEIILLVLCHLFCKKNTHELVSQRLRTLTSLRNG